MVLANVGIDNDSQSQVDNDNGSQKEIDNDSQSQKKSEPSFYGLLEWVKTGYSFGSFRATRRFNFGGTT